MDASTMERAFEPFFTTKAPGTGTGLGLATAHGTVAALGGIILAESTPGVGTTMRVQLPMMAPAAPEASIDAASEAGPTSDVRHVLVVDDEPLVLRATTRMLENRGLRVTPCGDPTETLDRIAGAEPAIDCVVTDFSMPGLNGLGLAARIRESHPRMPIVLVTGFLENQNAQRAAGAGVTRVLNKPFRSAQLLEAIAQACTEVSGGGGTHREGAPE
jgi:CheY-like chemotaxis protein